MTGDSTWLHKSSLPEIKVSVSSIPRTDSNKVHYEKMLTQVKEECRDLDTKSVQ